jgi:hypothetical protein
LWVLSAAPAGPPVGIDDADYVVIHPQYPVRMGKWQVVAEDVAERSRAHESGETSGSGCGQAEG